MPKKKIVVTLNNQKQELTWEKIAYLSKETLTYEEDKNTLVTFNFKKNELLRKTKEATMHFFFQEEPFLLLELNDLKQKTTIPLKVLNILKTSKSIEINYTIEKDLFTYKIEVI